MSYHKVNLDGIRDEIQTRIRNLESSSFSDSRFAVGTRLVNESVPQNMSSRDYNQHWDWVNSAAEYKRMGNLWKANDLLIKAFKNESHLEDGYIWNWCKVMMLAKNWSDLALLIKYFHALCARRNLIRKAKGGDPWTNFSGVALVDFNYDVARDLRGLAGSGLATKEELEYRIPPYGGNDSVWRNWKLTRDEYREFLRYFEMPGITRDGM